MGMKIKLDFALQQLAGDRDKIEVNGSTVKQCLEDFVKRFPPTRTWLFDKDGSLLSLVLVNSEVLTSDELDRPVTENDELSLLNLLEGG
jgi:hypothetical protein